ncbi:hypothetical protein AB0758_45570 [Tolypothrix bouteillei VB521301_2]|uniref:hypothetical protein n=1 Tax=Tolypothrix bouteillei TaxID=1246981 RepID=UPI0038B5573F
MSDNVFTITDREVFGGKRIAVVNNTGKPVNLPEPQDARGDKLPILLLSLTSMLLSKSTA